VFQLLQRTKLYVTTREEHHGAAAVDGSGDSSSSIAPQVASVPPQPAVFSPLHVVGGAGLASPMSLRSSPVPPNSSRSALLLRVSPIPRKMASAAESSPIPSFNQDVSLPSDLRAPSSLSTSSLEQLAARSIDDLRPQGCDYTNAHHLLFFSRAAATLTPLPPPPVAPDPMTPSAATLLPSRAGVLFSPDA
jgi:hypothetical protein